MTVDGAFAKVSLVDGVVVEFDGVAEANAAIVEVAEQAVDGLGPVPAHAIVEIFTAGSGFRAEVVDCVARLPLPSTSLGSSTLVLLAARLRSRGTIDDLRLAVTLLAGPVSPVVDRIVPALIADGALRSRGPTGRLSLAPRGSEALAAALSKSTDSAGRAEIEKAYAGFLPVNRDFLDAVSSWQHRKSEAVAVAVEPFGLLIDRLGPTLIRLSGPLPRFAGYAPRLGRALGRAVDRPIWIDSPSVDSVHTVWFELHEHLLASIGRSRSQER